MTITLLGTGTGVPSERRSPPCILMRFKDKHAVFDSGPGALKGLLKVGITCLDLDFLFYTHLHLDHVSELGAILFAAKIPPEIRTKPLAVYGPSGLKAYYKKIMELYDETLYTDAYDLDLNEIEDTTIRVEDFSITTRALRHHGGGMGYRITSPEGRTAVYSGDTDYCEGIIDLAKDADLLILECAFPDEMKMSGHLTPETAGKIARQSKVKKLVFVHMYPVCDRHDLIAPCKREFGGEIALGEDFMRLEV